MILIGFVLINLVYHSNDDYQFLVPLFYTNPIFRLTDFLAGMAIGLYFKEHPTISSWKLQLISIVTFIACLTIGITSNMPWVWKWSLYYLFPCAFVLFAFYGETKFSQAIFGHKFWLTLSAASMVIFLSHQEFWNAVRMYLPESISQLFYKYFMPWGVLAGMLCIVALSVVINKFFVKPTYHLLIRITNFIGN